MILILYSCSLTHKCRAIKPTRRGKKNSQRAYTLTPSSRLYVRCCHWRYVFFFFFFFFQISISIIYNFNYSQVYIFVYNNGLELYSGDHSKDRFGDILRLHVGSLAPEDQRKLGCAKEDIGTYSLRKGSSSYCLGQVWLIFNYT